MSVRTIAPTRGLKGEVTIPGDKSISHRSIMLGSIALGTTEITHFLEGADCLSTIDCFRKMGVEIERKPSSILVHGKGLRGLTAPASTLNVGNSGTTTRLISGYQKSQRQRMRPASHKTWCSAWYSLPVTGCLCPGKIGSSVSRTLCRQSYFCYRTCSFP